MFSPFLISAAGAMTAFGQGLDPFVEGVNRGGEALEAGEFRGALRGFDPKSFLQLDRVRGFDRLTLMVMAGIRDLHVRGGAGGGATWFERQEPNDVAACLGTAGPLSTISEFDFQVMEDPQFVQPSTFPNCVSCAPLGYASIYNQIRASNTTLSNGATSGLDSLGFVSSLLGNHGCKMVIAGGAEVLSPQYEKVQESRYRSRGLTPPEFSEAAVFFSCESPDARGGVGTKPLAVVLGYSTCFTDDHSGGFRWNWKVLQSQIGPWDADAPVFYLGSELFHKKEAQILAESVRSKFQAIDVAPLLGDSFSASGCLRLLYALVHDTIPSGALVLVGASCLDGNHSLLAVRKQ